jgi:hypothetical protein
VSFFFLFFVVVSRAVGLPMVAAETAITEVICGALGVRLERVVFSHGGSFQGLAVTSCPITAGTITG